jgi:putative ATPase
VIVLQRLGDADLQEIFLRGCVELGVDPDQLLTPKAREALFAWADGDARKLLTALETLQVHAQVQPGPFQPDDLSEILQKPALRYDKKNAEHYDTISAFIKSVRGSDADAAVYYLARMLAGGEDPVFLARRLVILASEDIGNADPRGIQVAVAGLQAVELVGMPEAAINLAQVTTYLSSAPKSNASYMALRKAQETVEKSGTLPIPVALRSARTVLAKQLGYGKDYKYAHDGETGWQKMEFLPEQLRGETFYEPTDHGFEKSIRQYMDWMKGRKASDQD